MLSDLMEEGLNLNLKKLTRKWRSVHRSKEIWISIKGDSVESRKVKSWRISRIRNLFPQTSPMFRARTRVN